LKQSMLVVLLLVSFSAYSQQDAHKENLGLVVKEDTAKAPKYGWKHSIVAGLTIGQVSFTDWAQGGENSLSYGLLVSGKSEEDHAARGDVAQQARQSRGPGGPLETDPEQLPRALGRRPTANPAHGGVTLCERQHGRKRPAVGRMTHRRSFSSHFCQAT